MTSLTVAVVICAYTMDRWADLEEAVQSVAAQTLQPDEVILVIDYNSDLLEAAAALDGSCGGLKVVPNVRRQGLSGARNSALELVEADVVAFLDDDAAADPGWLAHLVAPYGDVSVLAVGGSATPRWSAGASRPVTLPLGSSGRGELDWVVGCTYEGQPERLTPVRNMMGCNMSFRREIYERVGGFLEELGRVGKTPLGCEETEFCIRASRSAPGSLILFEPRAVVRHHVSDDRLTWRYLVRRCYAEGISKSAVSRIVGREQALETERSYVATTLPRGVARELKRGVRPGGGSARRGWLASAAILVALLATTAGYLRGMAAPGSGADATMQPSPVKSCP